MKTLREQAEEIKAKGSPLSIEQIISFLEKKEARAAKNMKRVAKKFEEREKYQNVKAGSLWGNGCKYSTQAEYQRACLHSRIELD